MKFSAATGAVVLGYLAHFVLHVNAGRPYDLSSSVVGEDFFSFFEWEAITDPTGGRVNYVDQSTAESLGLSYVSGDTFVMRVDDTTTLSSSDAGRNSVRIKSYNTYTSHVVVFNIAHMPQGCGTWPAVWETNESNWPAGGEVDIVEGVNDVSPNQATLHTSPGCSMPTSDRTESGTPVETDCDATVNGNSGCGVQFTEDYNSFGPNFNNIGGGWYAMERTNMFIKVWFWERSSSSVPSDVSSGASSVNPEDWGEAAAYFPNTDCDIESAFDANNIIINIDLCGDWAGSSSVYADAGCPSSCVDYVNENPSAFSEAYFQFNSINIYTS